MISPFIKKFTREKIVSEKIQDSYYLIQPELKSVVDKVPLVPFSVGLPLGEVRREKFFPSLSLLDWMSNRSEQKITIHSDALEWLFLCGRDPFKKNVEFDAGLSGLVLIDGPGGENLGYGLLSKQKKEIRNLLDRGDFLRRER